jgi:4a-hydroxytetrahydrobiopterin dehydratase
MSAKEALTQEEIEAGLKDLPGWKFENDKIFKEFQFKDFLDSLQFVNKMAPIFEEHDHHADTHIMYSKVLFELQRFDAGGKVTDRDLFIAGEIERNYKERS